MRNHPKHKDLCENEHLYVEDDIPADQQLSVFDPAEALAKDAFEDLQKCPDESLEGLLNQYRKDLLFERDNYSRCELRAQISRIEAEIELRKILVEDQNIKAALSESNKNRWQARQKAEAEFARLQKKAAA